MGEMIRIGAYRRGSDPRIDQAIDYNPALESFLSQRQEERADLHEGFQQLAGLLEEGGMAA